MIVMTVGLLLAVAAFMASRNDGDKAADSGDSRIAHVHGLGINPADGDLYVATHHGVFRIGEEQEAQRVGAGRQDTMGFTVAGPDRFLASGHPDLQTRRPGQAPHLGLIESDDGGKTWVARSLEGEADFHGLAFAHGSIYGADSTSGRFMVSSDGTNWETRGQQQLAAFAVDPGEGEHLIGVGPAGLVESTDGGRTWRAANGPPLAVLAWDEAALVGVEADGTVQRSTDGGATWQRVGRVDAAPQALFAQTGELYVAVAEEDGTTAIYRSDDGGATWALHYPAPG